ncbi:MAG: hypothetical protein K5686_02365 [Lachnospiraceae bacterium]|nr:hypothetical protein [Lachnospiraceae bacterium]
MKRKFIQKLIAMAGSVMMLTASLPAPVYAAADSVEESTAAENEETSAEQDVTAEETESADDNTAVTEEPAPVEEAPEVTEEEVPVSDPAPENVSEEAPETETVNEDTVEEPVEEETVSEDSEECFPWETVPENNDVEVEGGDDVPEITTPEVLEDDGVSEKEAEETVKDDEPTGVFTGITIDGNFSDWDAVSKTPAGASDFYCGVTAVAVVQQDDMVYVYIRDTGCGTASWSGPNMNGTFELISDLGYRKVLQLNSENNGAVYSVSGIEGAQVAYTTGEWDQGGEWEISFPASQLPLNNSTYGFGFYMVDPYITGIVDTSHEDHSKEFDGIVYDGLYGDWTYYPHTLIQYATPGTWKEVADGEGALYTQGNRLYGHVYTKMSTHLTEHGDEMTYGVVLRINGDNNLWFEFRLVTADEEGNVIWNPDTNRLAEGTYEYYITYHRGWSGQDQKKLADILGNEVYGKMMITKTASRDEAEWYLELGKIADLFGLQETDMQLLEVKYERIGDKWLQTAGASSGPVAGILLSMAVAGGALILRKKKTAELL